MNLKQEKCGVIRRAHLLNVKVSFNSGKAVLEALLKQGYNAHPIDPKRI